VKKPRFHLNPQGKIVVVGQGYVGLPIAMRAVEAGFSVVGLDISDRRVDSLATANSYVEDVRSSRLRAALTSGRYKPSSTYEDAAGLDAVIITVPTPLKEFRPDLSFIESAAESISSLLDRGAIVVLESTTYPGTTEELVVPILERGSGLIAGEDFAVGYSPERIDPGNTTWTFVNTPKVVSGINESSLEAVRALYGRLVEETVPVSTPKEAELTKLLENTFRHVNIALVNELAMFARQLGVDIWEAIDAASTKPFGYMRFTPGPGVGGHCLPVDPTYLSWQVRRQLRHNFRFVELANDINDHMPDYVVQRIVASLNRRRKSLLDSTVVLLGVAYKRNSSDVRESPALRIAELLTDFGAVVYAIDSGVEPECYPPGIKPVELSEEILSMADVVVLLTDHDDVDYQMVTQASPCVLDTRHRLAGTNVERL
jgi:UDP-N-acetyl-D-mannosaminuronic acid dehydrogenase/UDP-N-acetyl-D-glucosamine dehydrogenase